MSDDRLTPSLTIYIEDSDALDTLVALVEQIRSSGYRDKHQHRIELNTATATPSRSWSRGSC